MTFVVTTSWYLGTISSGKIVGMSTQQVLTPETFKSLGELIRYLRTRAGFSQRELAARVNYHYAHINRIESNQRLPDQNVLLARFVPALSLEDQPQWVQRLLELREEAESVQASPKKEAETHSQETHHVPVIPITLLGRKHEIPQLSKCLLHPETRLVTLINDY